MDIEFLELNRNKEALTEKELKELDKLSKEDLQDLITHCENEYNKYNAFQNGLKISMNSIYGAFGNEFFVCSTKDIAGAITAMGRDAVKYMDKVAETYAYEYWHIDEDLHKYLGINTEDIKQIDASYIHRESKTIYDKIPTDFEIEEGEYQRKISVINYVDTDSAFFNFDILMESCNWQGDPQEFVEKVAKFRLEPLFKKKLDNYAKKYGVKNLQDFELENINESVLFVAKKMYIKHTVWEDGTQYPRLKHLVPKGLQLIKKGTPKFAKKNVMDIILYIFDNPKTYNIKDLLKFVQKLRKEFELTDINDIVPTTNINSYWSSKILENGALIDGPGIIEDKQEYKYAKGTYFAIKAAGLYNHLLYQHPELINTYEVIKPGTKVKIYPCIDERNDKFCYIPGSYPAEFAAPVDTQKLFHDTVSKQVNTYLTALDLPILNERLKIIVSLFS